MFKDSGFCCHAKSQRHKTAMIAWAEYNKMSEKNESLMTAMDDHRQKQVLENQTYIKTIAEILILTATENIAQRGHRESADSNKRGIFLEMLNMVGNHDPVFKRRLEQQAKMLCTPVKPSRMKLFHVWLKWLLRRSCEKLKTVHNFQSL